MLGIPGLPQSSAARGLFPITVIRPREPPESQLPHLLTLSLCAAARAQDWEGQHEPVSSASFCLGLRQKLLFLAFASCQFNGVPQPIFSSANSMGSDPPAEGDAVEAADGNDESTKPGHEQEVSAARDAQDYDLWIIIFRGQPRDIQSTRVTDLMLGAAGHAQVNCTFRLDGQPGHYIVREAWDLPEPRLRDLFLQKLHVATWKASLVAFSTIQEAILSVPLRQTESDFNCQTWVGDVIDKLQTDGLIPTTAGDAVVDAMVKNIYQAPWE